MIMMQPALRFFDYKGSWKEGRLEYICSNFKSGSTITADSISLKGSFPVFGGNGLRGYTDREFTHDGYYLLIGRQGALCGNINEVSGKAFISEHAIVIGENDRSSIGWLKYKLIQMSLNRYSESSAQPGLSVGRLKLLKAFYPEKSEQQKIADFLTSVDTKISQLAEKHRLLKDYKKGVMQQIFSQQIRFKNDDGSAFPEWKEKVIGDVMTESRIKGNSGDIAKKLTVKIWGKGVIPKKDDSKGSENTQYYKRKAGQFIYGKLDFLNCAFAIIPDELDGYESTLDLPSLDVSSLVNKFFVLEVVKQKRFYKRFGEVADGSRKAKRINVGVFQAMPINLPSKAEQDKIMTFLQSLDKKIDAVNEQIEQAKLFKKGLLQQMFV